MKDLQHIIQSEIDNKKKWEEETYGMQKNYIKTIEDLKQELNHFKQKISEENN